MFALSAMQKITFATVWTGITLAFAFAPPPLGSIMNFRYSYFNEMMNVPGSQNRKRLQLVAGKETEARRAKELSSKELSLSRLANPIN